MKPFVNKILVKVNPDQKDYADFGGIQLFLASKFNGNNREKNPVVAYVLEGAKEIKTGQHIIVHHNYFSEFSPFEIDSEHYAIPYSENIFAIIDESGNAKSVCGNVIAERIEEDEAIGIANPKRRHYHDRVKIVDGEGYNTGDEVFTLPFSDYEIVYNWAGREIRIIRVFSQNIVAILKNY